MGGRGGHLLMLDRRVWSFLAIAFGLSWGVTGLGYALGVRDSAHRAYVLVAALAMFGPAVAAVIQQRWRDRESWTGLGLNFKGTRPGVVIATVMLGLLIIPTMLAVLYVLGTGLGWAAFGQVEVSSARLVTAIQEMLAQKGMGGEVSQQVEQLARVPIALVVLGLAVSAVMAAFTVNVPFMLGEELGWRGYLWQRLANLPGWSRVTFTGVVWGLWHAPLIALGHNYPGHPVGGVLMMVVFCLVLALLFDWTRSRSGSVWSSVVLHGLINGTAGATVLFAWGGHPLLSSAAGLAGGLAIALLGLVVLALDPVYRRQFCRAPDRGSI